MWIKYLSRARACFVKSCRLVLVVITPDKNTRDKDSAYRRQPQMELDVVTWSNDVSLSIATKVLLLIFRPIKYVTERTDQSSRYHSKTNITFYIFRTRKS